MPYLTSRNNIPWYYEACGQGQSLLLLHGWAADSRIWSQQVEYFKNFYQVITVDLPGHGQSHWTEVSLEDMAEDLDILLRALRVQAVSLMASSFGALVALKYFAVFPEKIRRLIFVGGLPRFAQSKEFPYGVALPRIRKLREQVETDFPQILNVFFRSLFTVQERRSLHWKWLAMFRPGNDLPCQAALVRLLRMIEKEDLTSVFLDMRMPVCLMTGRQDDICPPEALRYFQSRLPQARVLFFEDCGHFPFLSRPREFNQLLDEFLRATDV